MGVASYVRDIKDTLTSVFEGMSITFSHLVRRPMTIQYPDKIPKPIQETLPRRYRHPRSRPRYLHGLFSLRERLSDYLHHDRHRNGQGDKAAEIYPFRY